MNTINDKKYYAAVKALCQELGIDFGSAKKIVLEPTSATVWDRNDGWSEVVTGSYADVLTLSQAFDQAGSDNA